MKGISFDWSLLQSPKRLLMLGIDIFCTILSLVLAYFLRFNFTIPELYFPTSTQIVISLSLLVFFRIASFFLFGLYSGVLRYASIDDLLRIVKAVTVGTLLFISSIAFIFRLQGFPRSVFLIDWFIILVLLGGSRFVYRIWKELRIPLSPPEARRKALIVGAGDVGEMVLRSIKREQDFPYEVMGIVDDDPDKIGRRIHGVEVLDRISNLEEVIRKGDAKEVIIAIQNISGRKIREITELCQTIGVSCKMVPSVGGILGGSISVSHIRPVQVEGGLVEQPLA